MIKLNFININKQDKNSKSDCIILEYDINDEKNFEEIKLFCNEKLKENHEVNLIYLIGIKKDSDEEKTKDEAKNFCEDNNLRFFIVSHKKENDLKLFINYLLSKFKKEKNNFEGNKEKEQNKKVYKICFIGGCGVGAKTSLINVIKGLNFDDNETSTSSPSCKNKRLELIGQEIDLELWDTVGQKLFRDVIKPFIKVSDIIVIGFDITCSRSFQEIIDFYNLAKDNCNAKLMYLIGNKIDLKEEREISEEKARDLAKELNLRYFETSCLTGQGIYNFVYDLANEIIKY